MNGVVHTGTVPSKTLSRNERSNPMKFGEVKEKIRVGAADANDPSGDTPRLTVSVEEAGRILGISRGAAYARAGDGSLPTVRLGKRLLVPKGALQKMLQID
jgi:excisionase family DNA binding protein